tara:strand:+ start:1227 stop:2114 length:888 start_codon:yes stop_codon:yes gene_type:complete
MQVLVTGSSGFLGKHLCDSIEKLGHSVVEYDLDMGFDILDEAMLETVIQERKVTDVVHLAAIADLYVAGSDPNVAWNINVEGTKKVLSVCERNGIPMLFASTCCAYGNNDVHPSNEMAPLNPGEIYAKTKVAAEKLFSGTSGQHTIMRLATFYGPNQRGSLATSIFLERAKQGLAIEIHGDGEQTRTFTHVQDVVNGIICILKSQLRPAIVNISTDQSYSVNELAEICMQLTQQVEIKHIPDRSGQILHEEIDNGLLRSLGWVQQYDLRKGLSTCINTRKRINQDTLTIQEVLTE